MAFDQATRNRLQKFVSDARKLLSEEFTQQLQNTYGLDPVTGGMAELSALPALSPSEQQTAILLRDTLEHYLATSHKADPHKDKSLVIAALDRIVREQAFTVLNRLAALRMAEARQFVMESISQGYQSKGFQLYQRIAGSSLGETGQAYQHYLFSVFDELSLDLAVLFDRYSSQGRLFPRETVLLELLDLINHAELEMLWGEDETVGWIYQYFNSKEERKKMRDESHAPRNSRELAVRNQFFTPRYVVEFLTDNTLGRIWYEMTQGNTALVNSCRYLVKRPNEIFLKSGEQKPENDEQKVVELSQAELLQQTVYIQHRPIKDPRDIKMLDPACGSMHFGLYAFDLFEQIYTEAWDIELAKGSEIFFNEEGVITRTALHETYPTKEAFLADVPRLIIEHNIYGVDIDPRAVQIAGLSLWLRAQKSWSDNAIKPNQRPQIKRSNIVCAEPMPGEKELLKEFTSQIQPRVLGQLVEDIFNKMQLAGEAGTLLKIEEEIQSAIEEAKSQKDENVLEVQGGLFGGDKWEVPEGKRYYNFGDVSDDFWGQAEQLILSELERYAETASVKGSGSKRLFAADAAKGFAFIDLCRKEFDIVLMNPPFGEFSERYKEIASKKYTGGNHDIIAAFIERTCSLKNSKGLIGCISSRAVFYGPTNSTWRERVVIPNGMPLWVELGEGVLDDAMVETVMYTIGGSMPLSSFYRKPDLESFSSVNALNQVSAYCLDLNDFSILNGSPFAYWISRKVFNANKSLTSLKDTGVDVKVGLQTGDDFRFIRLACEVPNNSIGNEWFYHAKGGDNSPYYSDTHLVVNWKGRGTEVAAQSSVRLNMYSGSSDNLYLVEGLTFSYRTYRFSPAKLYKNTITGVAGMGMFPDVGDIDFYMGLFNSSLANEFINVRLGHVDSRSLYQAGAISPTPVAEFPIEVKNEIAILAKENHDFISSVFKYIETSELFEVSRLVEFSPDVVIGEFNKMKDLVRIKVIENYEKIDNLVNSVYHFAENDFSNYSLHKNHIEKSVTNLMDGCEIDVSSVISALVGLVFGRYIYSKNPVESNVGFLSKGDLTERVKNACDELYEGGFDEFCGCESFQCSGYSVDLFDSNLFFDEHLKKYSRSRRQAPLYWPLQSADGEYTVWVYFCELNSQTLLSIVNDYIEPEIKSLSQTISRFDEASLAERLSERMKLQKKCDELNQFREELLDVSGKYNPVLFDGVQITAAPLWKLFSNRVWRGKLRKTWDELESGKFDWSGIAFSYWPVRVLEKAYVDRSIAIGHRVEADLWNEVKVQVGKSKKIKLAWQPKEMSKSELNTYIQQKIAQG